MNARGKFREHERCVSVARGAVLSRLYKFLLLPYFDASTSPLESFFDSPQLSVGRKSKSIAQQNTPALQAICRASTRAML